MPVATPSQYRAMLDAAADGAYAYAAINVTSSETLNAALRGFKLADADGIVQISVGGAEYVRSRKVNVDTDNQYAFTCALAGHVLDHWHGVLNVDGGIGDKHSFDPRAWGSAGEAAMAERVRQACEQLGSAGRSLAAPASASDRAGRSLLDLD